jgi:hypothetical protein
MEETTLRNFKTMLTFLSDYREHKIDLRWLVDALEGSINALEEKMSGAFFLEWHRHWDKLEVVLALDKEDEVAIVLTELNSLEMLIEKTINQERK